MSIRLQFVTMGHFPNLKICPNRNRKDYLYNFSKSHES